MLSSWKNCVPTKRIWEEITLWALYCFLVFKLILACLTTTANLCFTTHIYSLWLSTFVYYKRMSIFRFLICYCWDNIVNSEVFPSVFFSLNLFVLASCNKEKTCSSLLAQSDFIPLKHLTVANHVASFEFGHWLVPYERLLCCKESYIM